MAASSSSSTPPVHGGCSMVGAAGMAAPAQDAGEGGGGDETTHVMGMRMPSALPASLATFMSQSGVEDGIYEGADDIDRHIRINPRRPIAIKELAKELELTPKPVTWLPSLLSMPSSTKIASTEAYKRGRVYGIDLASAAAVIALDPQPGDVVLDLCCAPGAKLCMISDLVTPSTNRQRQPGGEEAPSANRQQEPSGATVDDEPGFVVGVDVSSSRLSTCRGMVKKYGNPNVRLYLADGASVHVPRPCQSTAEEAQEERQVFMRRISEGKGGKRKRGGRGSAECVSGEGEDEGAGGGGKEAGGASMEGRVVGGGGGGGSESRESWLRPYFFESSCNVGGWIWSRGCERVERGQSDRGGGEGKGGGGGICGKGGEGGPGEEEGGGRGNYDRVLVDAECTHDGSVKHVAKLAKMGRGDGADPMEDRVFNAERMSSLEALQRGLLLNGFRHLRPGGVLIYSTCSFSITQNDQVVEWLLSTEPTARPMAIESKAGSPCRDGDASHVMRFDPGTSRSSGLFMAKITKIA